MVQLTYGLNLSYLDFLDVVLGRLCFKWLYLSSHVCYTLSSINRRSFFNGWSSLFRGPVVLKFIKCNYVMGVPLPRIDRGGIRTRHVLLTEGFICSYLPPFFSCHLFGLSVKESVH